MSEKSEIEKALKACDEEIKFYQNELKQPYMTEYKTTYEAYISGHNEAYSNCVDGIEAFRFIKTVLKEKQYLSQYADTNKFVTTIRNNVKYPNTDGNYGAWDILNREQRKFLIECADFIESMECVIGQFIAEKQHRNQGCNLCNNPKLNRITATYESGISENKEIEAKYCGNCGREIEG